LPTASEVQATLVSGRPLTPADRLALRRDGQIQATPDQMDTMLRLAAQHAYFDGQHGTRRPAPHLTPYLRSAELDDQAWPVVATEVWPAWAGDAGSSFAHRAVVAVWLADGANPWVPWGEEAGMPWSLPEVLIAANDVGMLRRVLAHPACPDVATLMTRRLAPLKDVRGQQATPWLHASATLPDGTVLGELLARGFDPSQVDGMGRTALFYIAGVTPLKQLLAAGADPERADAQREPLRAFLARSFADYATTLAPLLAQSLSASATIEEAFGQGRRGEWPAVEAAMKAAGPAWTQWRQPITLKNGQVRDASWLGSAALGLLDPDANPRFGEDFNWRHERIDVLPATDHLLREATDGLLAHETLPGLPDGLAWSAMLHAIQGLQLSSRQFQHGSPAWHQANGELQQRLRDTRDAWDARIMPGQTAVERQATRVSAMAKVLNLYGPPRLWRDQILRTLSPAFAAQVGHGMLNQAANTLEWNRPMDRPAIAKMPAEWAAFWSAVTAVLGDKTLRATLTKDVIDAIHRVGAPYRDVLVPAAVRSALGSMLWLGQADQDGTVCRTSDENTREQRWSSLWATWAQAGIKLDLGRLGGRGRTKLEGRFPHLVAARREVIVSQQPAGAPSRPRHRA